MATVKRLSYAGIALPLPTAQLEAGWLAQVQNIYDFLDLDSFNFNSGLSSFPTPSIPLPPRFQLNTLYWPTGASRPAWFHAVVDEPRLLAIRLAVGSTALAAPLVLFDGRAGKTITAQMRMVAERPINVTTGESGEKFYLITLTDDRFFWYMRRGIVTAPSSWANLLSQLGVLLGVSITTDTINSAYLTPSSKWATAYCFPSVLLDAAAAQIGQRIVVGLNGAVYSVNWETAKTASDLYFATADAPVAGGRVSASGIARFAPASVRTVFPDNSSGTYSSTPYVVSNSLVSLAVPGYGAATGLAGYYESTFGDTPYSGSNATALATYAAAAATDLYGWRLSDADVAWPGVEPFTPTGWEDRIEWTFTVRGGEPFALTTVRRGPWMDLLAGSFQGGPSKSSVSSLTVEEVDGDPSVENVTKIQFDQDDGFVVSEVSAGISRVDFNPTKLIGPPPRFGLTIFVVEGNTYLGVNLGCGLEFDDDGAIQVDAHTLVGARATTSLTTGEAPCGLAFDKEIDSTHAENFVEDVEINYPAPGSFQLRKTRKTMTDRYNAAHVQIDTQYGEPVVSTYTVNVCDLLECCGADPLDVVFDPGPFYGDAPLVVNFTVSATGGSGSFSYFWDFDDGSTSTAQNPTHTFTLPGVYAVTITVTDDVCGMTERNTIYVYVSEPCGCDPCAGGFSIRYQFTLSGGTGDFVGANGVWTIYHINDCTWVGFLSGTPWRVVMTLDSSRVGTLTFTNSANPNLLLEYLTDDVPDCCEGWEGDQITLTDSVGTGTAPAFVSPDGNIEPLDECVPCAVETTCCEELIPTTLNWQITAITGLCSCIVTTSGTVTYNVGSGQWEGITFTCPLLECEENAEYQISCVGSTWYYGILGAGAGGLAATSVACSPPFQAIFNKTVGGGSYTITFTAP